MAREKNEKLWIGGGVVASLMLAGAVWTFVVSPQMDDVSTLQSQTADAQTQNLTLQSNVGKLRDEYAHIGITRSQLAAAQAQLPSVSGLSDLTNQLSAQARANHVTVTQFNAAAPTAVSATATAPVSAAPTSSSAAPGAAVATVASGLYSIQVSVTVTGKQTDEVAFARAVQQQGPRSALVTSVQIQNLAAGTSNSSVGGSGSSLTVQMNVFVAPQAAAPAAASGTPTPTPTPSAGA